MIRSLGRPRFKKILFVFLEIILLIATLLCVFYLVVLFGISHGWFNVEAKIDIYNNDFNSNYQDIVSHYSSEKSDAEKESDLNQKIEQLNQIKLVYPDFGQSIESEYQKNTSYADLSNMLLATNLALRRQNLNLKSVSEKNKSPFLWVNDTWEMIYGGTLKDKDAIDLAASKVEINPRILFSVLEAEQLRDVYTSRERIKNFFSPLRIFKSGYQVSVGVMSIKETTAVLVENHLKDKNSVFYPGPDYENLLDFDSKNIDKERHDRLTGVDHYYSYLYAAIYIKELENQWKKAGYPIDDRPEIISTLYNNVGFSEKTPKKEPRVGGSTLKISGLDYTFGSLAYEIYYSGQLNKEFPL